MSKSSRRPFVRAASPSIPPATPAPETNRPIIDGLAILEAQVDALFHAVGALADRMVPVLAPTADAVGAEGKPPDSKAVSARIYRAGGEIGQVTSLIHSLTARLEV